jgi:uridine kinase
MSLKTALVAGPSGSGKTLIAKQFQYAYILSMDDYFRGPFPLNKDNIPEWDKPCAIDFNALISDYQRLKEAITLKQSINLPRYQFKTGEILEERIDFAESQWSNIQWLVIEGLFALDHRLLPFADFKVFVDAPFQVRVSRRLARDMNERSGNLMFILLHSYYTEESYRAYIHPQKQHADIVILNYDLKP